MSRIAIVTGASSGLGREFVKRIDAGEAGHIDEIWVIARRLERRIDAGEAGHIDEIWVIARRLERLEALRRTCATPVRPFCLDLSDASSYEVVEVALTETPGAEVALLVNTAGFGVFGNVAAQDKADGGRMVRLLMQAPVELIYRSLPYLRSGSRIITSTTPAIPPPPRR